MSTLLRIREVFTSGASLAWSAEKLSAANAGGGRTYFDFSNGQFVASPSAPVTPTQAITELGSPRTGLYDKTFTLDPTQWTDGDYAIYIHNAGSANVVINAYSVTIIGGDDAQARLVGAGVDAISCDGSMNLRQLQSVVLALVTGHLAGLPAGPAVFKDPSNTNTRASITFDANNNRTAVTLSPPA